MRNISVFVMIFFCAAVCSSAQTDLNESPKDGHFILKMDMPSNREGVPFYSERSSSMNYGEYAGRQRDYDLSFIRQVSGRSLPRDKKRGVVRLGPPTTYLKKGLRTEEVLQVLGKPSAVSKRVEQGAVVTTLEFPRGEDRVLIAEFVNDALVRSRIESRGQPFQRMIPALEFEPSLLLGAERQSHPAVPIGGG